MRLLITAGPTREYLDRVRFLSNASSGKMGFALAEAARRAGHEVVLVSGPVSLETPDHCRRIPVETTHQMLTACLEVWPQCDGVIGAAAVCDYRPRVQAEGKLKKSGQPLLLELVETEDVLAELGRTKQHRFVVGFALEADDGHVNAVRKLNTKACDAIVLNAPSAIDADDSRVELIGQTGRVVATWSGAKSKIADRLVAWIEANLAPSRNS